jgi:aminopeptidase-like protein
MNIQELITRLCELRRDLVSDGYDAALDILREYNPAIKVHEYPTGTQVWDWVIPHKWECDCGWVRDMRGHTVIDTSEHPMHVMSYSQPIDQLVSYSELEQHLHSNPHVPSGIPFEFSYYEPRWGFCIQHNHLPRFEAAQYHVHIDSEFSAGSLKVGELYLPGTTKQDIVLTAHLCHPYQANDNASGIAALLALAGSLPAGHRYGYRFLFVPETIGTIAYLAHNEALIPQIKYAIAVDMLGTKPLCKYDTQGNENEVPLVLQCSRQGDTQLDKAAEIVLRRGRYEVTGFCSIIGNDEKVLNARGVDIPSISLARTQLTGQPYYGYHTHMDNAKALDYAAIERAIGVLHDILRVMDQNMVPLCTVTGPVCLSRHNLWVDYRRDPALNRKQAHVLNMLNGKHTLVDIAHELALGFDTLKCWIDELSTRGVVDG